MVESTLNQRQLPADVVMQVTEMVRAAVDKALRQLMANGGATPTQAAGYQHAARTKEELLATPAADPTTVPADQVMETAGMDEGFLKELASDAPADQGIIVPKEDGSGWKF